MHKSEYVQVESLRDERMYTSAHSAPRHRTPPLPDLYFRIEIIIINYLRMIKLCLFVYSSLN